MLNLLWVRSFLAMMEKRSFREAAEALGLAQPTMSLHIQKLEEQLGAALFRRSRTGCEPTPDALRFHPYAESIIRVNDRALASVNGNRVRIGASSNIGTYLLQPLIRSYLQQRAPADVDLVIDRNPDVARRLENSEIDVAVMEWWDGRAGCRARLWKSEPIVVIMPPWHELAKCSVIDRNELIRFDMLGGEAGTGTGRLLAKYFGNTTAMPKITRQLGSTEAVKQAVKAGLGISLVLASSVTDEIKAGSLVAIPVAEPVLSKDLFVAWRASPADLIPSFAQHLLQNAAV